MSPTLAPTPGEFGARENGGGGACVLGGGAGRACIQQCQVRTGGPPWGCPHCCAARFKEGPGLPPVCSQQAALAWPPVQPQTSLPLTGSPSILPLHPIVQAGPPPQVPTPGPLPGCGRAAHWRGV